jgi:hypothetical protein
MGGLADLASISSELIDRLEQEHGEECKIRGVMMLVEVDAAEEDTSVVIASSDDRSWVQLAFLNEAVYRLERLQSLAEEREEQEDD